MGFKTILVHLGPDAESERRLAAAVGFARSQDAYLRALYAAMPMDFPGLPLGASMTDAMEAAQATAEAARTRFEAICAGEGLRHSWLLELGDPAEHLALHARYADTVVIGRDPPKNIWRSALNDFHADLSEFLPFASPCPVLVLPPGQDARIDTDTILIAWKSSREASKAVREALPLLKEAKRVVVLTVLSTGEPEATGAGISHFLAEHGVNVDLHQARAGEREVGRTILEEARLAEAGLIVMGVYGHPRLTSRIMGGVSKYVLEHATVPLMVTH